jgi:hypothetical protein
MLDGLYYDKPDVALVIFYAIGQALLALVGAQMVLVQQCHCCFFHLLRGILFVWWFTV